MDTKFFFGKVIPLYRMATAARGVKRITLIEGQYMDEVRRLNLVMKPCDFRALLGLRHLQSGHRPEDWWQGLALEPGDWD